MQSLTRFNVGPDIRLISGIVPLLTMPLKGGFVVFSKQLLTGYFRLGKVRLGDYRTGLGNWPAELER